MPVGEEFAIANDLDAYIPCLLHAQLLRILATPGPAANRGPTPTSSARSSWAAAENDRADPHELRQPLAEGSDEELEQLQRRKDSTQDSGRGRARRGQRVRFDLRPLIPSNSRELRPTNDSRELVIEL